MTAPAFGVDNLVAILDCNRIQKMDFVEKTIGSTRWREKWEAFGWEVLETDGHDMEAFKSTLLTPVQMGKPRVIIAHTTKGKGVSIMENNPNWHFKLPGRKELKVFMEELGISNLELE
jgi:transketolase